MKNYKGEVDYQDENYGDSGFADRFGIQRYPAVFVDDALIARPDDFGFYGKDHDDEDRGKYVPWRDPANHRRFQQDLERMIELRLKGKEIESVEFTQSEDIVETLPDFEMTTLRGKPLKSADFLGKVTIVEFWASWCPPCQRTLTWLAEVKQRHGERVGVLAIAVESKEEDIRRMAESMRLSYPVVFGNEEQVAPFGDLFAVPTMYLFDRKGRRVFVFYGAPPDLHEKAGELIEKIL